MALTRRQRVRRSAGAWAALQQDAAGLPEGAVGYVSFLAGTFYTEGGTETIGDILMNDPANGWPFDPSNVIDGVGLVGQDADARPRIIGTLLDQILAGGTIVFDFEVTSEATSAPHIKVLAYDDPDFNLGWGVTFAPLSVVSPGIYADGPMTDIDRVTVGPHKAALTIKSTGVSVSIDGAAVLSDAGTPSDFALLNAAGAEVFEGFTLRSIAVYPVMTNAEMIAASAL